jgi:hypothetical protein
VGVPGLQGTDNIFLFETYSFINFISFLIEISNLTDHFTLSHLTLTSLRIRLLCACHATNSLCPHSLCVPVACYTHPAHHLCVCRVACLALPHVHLHYVLLLRMPLTSSHVQLLTPTSSMCVAGERRARLAICSNARTHLLCACCVACCCYARRLHLSPLCTSCPHAQPLSSPHACCRRQVETNRKRNGRCKC